MKKLIFCAALFAAISFAACSDDDESNLPVTEANIVGTWKIVHEQGYEDDGHEIETWSEDSPFTDSDGYWWYWTYTFDEGGTGTYTEYEEGDSSPYLERFSYSISGNTLKMSMRDLGCQIKSLTKSRLVLFESHDDNDGSHTENTMTYKRIK